MITNLKRRRVSSLACVVVAALACAAAAPVLAAPAKASAAAEEEMRPVDLNRASPEALTRVPGIGKATADRIVAFREANGPFRRVEDLLKVKGIGEKSLEKLRPHLTVSKSK